MAIIDFMKVIVFMFSAFMIGPFLGLWMITPQHEDIFGRVADELMWANFLYIFIFSVTAFVWFYVLNGFVSILGRKVYIGHCKHEVNYNRLFIVVALVLLIVLVTQLYLGGAQILLGNSDRGEVRSSLGYLGPVYAWIVKYLSPTMLSLIAGAWVMGDSRTGRLHLFVCFILTALIGFATGYKATALMMVLPAVAIVSFKVSNFVLLVFAILGLGSIVLSGFIFGSAELIAETVRYVIYRATAVAAYGSIAVWNLFPDGYTRIYDSMMARYWGDHVATSLWGMSRNSLQFLYYDVSRLITYLVYPDTERALSGEVNLTISSFGEGVMIFGRQAYLFFALMLGSVTGVLTFYWSFLQKKQSYWKLSLLSTYLFFVLVPIINSGGVVNLVSLPTTIYFGLLFIVVALFREFVKKDSLKKM